MDYRTIEEVSAQVVSCRRCKRLVSYRESLPARASYSLEEYWRRPVAGYGDPNARLIIIGLAPAAHGGNRTGRVFTGDEAGRFLFEALHAVGLSNRPQSVAPGDGLRLRGALITAACRCAPPGNQPLPSELDNCREYLEREL